MNIEGLSLDQMRVALAVAEEGSFSAAARRFGRTQSAVSYAITALEKQIGMSIFERTTQRAQLTPVGRQLLKDIARIVAQADSLKHRAELLCRGVEAELGMVVDALFDKAIVVATLKEFREVFPETRIDLHTEILEGVTKRVLDGCDIGILASLSTVPQGVSSSSLAPISLLPVAHPRHPLAAERQSLALARGEHVQIVVSDRTDATDREFFVFGTKTWTVSDLAVKHALLQSGLGWGYMPRHLVEADLRLGRLATLSIEGAPVEDHQPTFVIWSDGRGLGQAGQWLVDRLKAGGGTG